MSERRITPQQVIDDAIEHALRDLPKCAPAKVVKWDASKGRANCQILVKQVFRDEEEARQVKSWPVITGVPVQFMGSGDFRLTVPIYDGTDGTNDSTTGLLIWSHLSIDKWLTGSGGEVDPEIDHQHGLADAIFIPGLRPFGSPWATSPTDRATFGSDSVDAARIECTSSGVNLGAGATKEVARKGDAVKAGSITATADLATGVVTFIYYDADGVPQPLSSGTTAILDGGKITGGSSHIKAVD